MVVQEERNTRVYCRRISKNLSIVIVRTLYLEKIAPTENTALLTAHALHSPHIQISISNCRRDQLRSSKMSKIIKYIILINYIVL